MKLLCMGNKMKFGVHELTGEKVIIKVVKKKRILDNKIVRLVNQELVALKRVRHPNVV